MSAWSLKINTMHAKYLNNNHTELCSLQFKEELIEILQGRSIGMFDSTFLPVFSSSLAYQPSPVEGYSITSCNSNNHFHSDALPLSYCCLPFSVSHFLLYSPLVIENGQLSTLDMCCVGSKGKRNVSASNLLQLMTITTTVWGFGVWPTYSMCETTSIHVLFVSTVIAACVRKSYG